MIYGFDIKLINDLKFRFKKTVAKIENPVDIYV